MGGIQIFRFSYFHVLLFLLLLILGETDGMENADINHASQKTGSITYAPNEANYVNVVIEKRFQCGTNETILIFGVCKQEGYQEMDRPNKTQTKIYYQLQDTEIHHVKEEENTIQISMKFSKTWTDSRITVDPSYTETLRHYGVDGISFEWDNGYPARRPHIWFPGGIKMPHVTNKRINDEYATVIFATGESDLWPPGDPNATRVVQEIDIHISLSCDFDLGLFPFDTQYCDLFHSNNGKTGLSLHLFPKTKTSYNRTLIKDGFTFTSNVTEGYNDKNHSFVGFKFKIERITSPYVIQYYLPCAAIVGVSQISFIIPPSSVPGRTGLLATLFLTLTNLFINHMVHMNLYPL